MSRPPAVRLPFTAGCAVGSALLGIAPLALGVIGSVLSLLSPAPVLLAYAKYGSRQGRLTAAGALLLAALATGFDPPGLLFYAAMSLPLAVAAGELLRAGHGAPRAIAGGTLLAVVIMAVTMAIGTGGDLEGLEQIWQRQWSQVEATIGHAADQSEDISPEQRYELSEQLRAIGGILYHTTPGIIFGFCLLVTWGNVLLIRQIAARQTGQKPQRLADWQTPFHMIWFLAAALAVAAFGDGWLFWLGVNMVIALCMIYFLQGMGFLTHFMKKHSVPMWFRVCVYIMVFVASQTSLILLAIAGLFDTCFNLRRFAVGRPG